MGGGRRIAAGETALPAVHHIAFSCADRHAQEAFYRQHFGFERCRVFRRGEPGEFVMLRRGDCCLELFGAADGTARGGEQPVGFKHLAFEVEDLDAAVADLRADGIEPDPIIDCGSIVPGLRICFLRDAEGNIIELMQGWQDEEGA